jgi:hypothetical protein
MCDDAIPTCNRSIREVRKADHSDGSIGAPSYSYTGRPRDVFNVVSINGWADLQERHVVVRISR